MPTVQRRSNPVKGRVLDLVVVVVGVLVAFAGAVSFLGELASFDGEVPLAGVGVVFGAGGVEL